MIFARHIYLNSMRYKNCICCATVVGKDQFSTVTSTPKRRLDVWHRQSARECLTQSLPRCPSLRSNTRGPAKRRQAWLYQCESYHCNKDNSSRCPSSKLRSFQMSMPPNELLNRYIATQGPLPNTCEAFWRMIWEQECTLILMLTTLFERSSFIISPTSRELFSSLFQWSNEMPSVLAECLREYDLRLFHYSLSSRTERKRSDLSRIHRDQSRGPSGTIRLSDTEWNLAWSWCPRRSWIVRRVSSRNPRAEKSETRCTYSRPLQVRRSIAIDRLHRFVLAALELVERVFWFWWKRHSVWSKAIKASSHWLLFDKCESSV